MGVGVVCGFGMRYLAIAALTLMKLELDDEIVGGPLRSRRPPSMLSEMSAPLGGHVGSYSDDGRWVYIYERLSRCLV